jgi:hypothetical protein
MPATYEPIATTTLGSAAASITFSSIASSWTDLKLVLVVPASPDTSGNININLNSDSGTNYSDTKLIGNGSAASSSRTTSAVRFRPGDGFNWTGSSTAPVFYEMDFFSYAGSTNKTVLFGTSEDRNGAGSTKRNVGLWRNTAAITTIAITTDAGTNYPVGTTATLYGIKNA